MNKLFLAIITILMIGFLAMTWVASQQNERANRLAEELYKEPVQSTEINWIPTYIVIQDPQGRPRARGTIFLVNTKWDTEIK